MGEPEERRGRCFPLSEICASADGVLEPIWNMAIDQAIFNEMVEGNAPPSIRLYTWMAPAITIGRFQDVGTGPEHTSKYLPVARRFTGGRGIVHGDDLTVSIAVPLEWLELRETASVPAVYLRLAEAFVLAFKEIGILTAMGGCCAPGLHNKQWNCMEVSTRADIINAVSGAKLVGSALRKSGAWVLQQSSIPLQSTVTIDPNEFSRLLVAALGQIMRASFSNAFYNARLLGAARSYSGHTS